jgi:hypothetical protein
LRAFLWLLDQIIVLRAIAGISTPPFRIAAAHLHCEKRIEPLHSRSHGMTNNRNALYLIIAVLVIAISVLGYNLYQAKKEPEGLQINVGPNGLKIQNK